MVKRFKTEVFGGLLHFPVAWSKPSENLKVGDLVLIHYNTKSKAGDWKWGRVLHADPDCDGLV